ncbi:MAG: hypothetical protein GDA56_09335 [Hormoscilla sp. GM7CHS1pb]|nr:hypothetical protein [Hormoscilla sp. GM7CHS1pb]
MTLCQAWGIIGQERPGIPVIGLENAREKSPGEAQAVGAATDGGGGLRSRPTESTSTGLLRSCRPEQESF